MADQSEPLSDRVVKTRQIDVLSIAEGFFQSSVLFALLKLRIFERIDEGTMTLDGLASEVGARPETLSRLLNAGVVLKLLESQDGIHFGVSPACRTVLSPSAVRTTWVIGFARSTSSVGRCKSLTKRFSSPARRLIQIPTWVETGKAAGASPCRCIITPP